MIDILLSHVFHTPATVLKVGAALPPGSRVMVDSGAYTAWTKGTPVGLRRYDRWLRECEGGWNWAVTLDVIGDTATTRSNTEWLRAQGWGPDRLMPVIHVGAPMSEWEWYRDQGWEYVGAGGMRPLLRDQAGMTKYLRTLVAHTGLRIHALGVGNPAVVVQSGVHSADSSAVSMGPLMGGVVVRDGRKLRMQRLDDREGVKRLAMSGGLSDGAGLLRSGRWESGRRVEMWADSLRGVGRYWEELRARVGREPLGGEDTPRYYSSLTTTEGTEAAVLAGRQWDL